MQSIKVKHNMEMAHRLIDTPGKCENIHGHSWWVELEIIGSVDRTGKILEFGAVKKAFREFLDSQYDHHLLLNVKDLVLNQAFIEPDTGLPGAIWMVGDPTTENVAKAIGEWAENAFYDPNASFHQHICVTVWETSTNAATWSR